MVGGRTYTFAAILKDSIAIHYIVLSLARVNVNRKIKFHKILYHLRTNSYRLLVSYL